MVIPEKEKGVRSFRIPALFFKSFAFISVLVIILIGIFSYNYWNVLQQVYENKHLTLENRQLREQIQLFQMKINSLANDMERINTFEKKLRIITGLEDIQEQPQIVPDDSKDEVIKAAPDQSFMDKFKLNINFEDFKDNKKFVNLKTQYDTKIATTLGIQKNYSLTKKWSSLINRSFKLSEEFASFDFRFNQVKEHVSDIEVKIHTIDQHLLNKDSFLKSTPTILPTKGWITSYFGQRLSPYHGRIKMHEGLDVGAPIGRKIFAPADGLITYSGIKAGFGKFVQIDHGYGIETLYAHAHKLLAKKGQKIKRGQHIAQVGNTGHSTGPHLHYEVRVNGIAVDPLYFVLEK